MAVRKVKNPEFEKDWIVIDQWGEISIGDIGFDKLPTAKEVEDAITKKGSLEVPSCEEDSNVFTVYEAVAAYKVEAPKNGFLVQIK